CRKALLLCGLLILVSAATFAASGESTKKTEANTATLDSASTPGEIATGNDSSDPQAPRQTKRGEAGLIGVGLRLSTLGAGAEVGVSLSSRLNVRGGFNIFQYSRGFNRSEEHTSELQSRFDLVCRLLLEKKNKPRC